MNRTPRLFAAIFSLASFLPACSGGNKNTVVAIEKTGTYHREICPPVNMAKTKLMTVAEAKADHLRPCKICKPDTL